MKNKDSNTQEIFIIPPFKKKLDTSSILSFSFYDNSAAIITRDYKVIACGKVNNYCIQQIYLSDDPEQFSEFEIKDDSGKRLFPISAYVNSCYTLYLVSEVPNGYKTKLLYCYENMPSQILNIGDSNPIAIFGGFYHSAAIDMDGRIIYISKSFHKHPDTIIEPQKLPGGEKAIELVCGNDYFYALSSTGKLFVSNTTNLTKLSFKLVKEFNKARVKQISGTSDTYLLLTYDGKVYSHGDNRYGQLGIGNEKSHINKFTEIVELRKYKINAVYSGSTQTLFQTYDGQILACGHNTRNQCIPKDISKFSEGCIFSPTETKIACGASFCISSYYRTAIFIGFDAEMSPNRRINTDVRIALFGGKEKTLIANAFINNDFETESFEKNKDEYNINIEINKSIIKIILIDSSQYENDNELRLKCYYRAPYFLFFYDVSNSSSSFDEFKKFYDEAKSVWFGKDIKCTVITYNPKFFRTFDPLPKSIHDEIEKKYHCKVFEVYSKEMEIVDEPFYYILQQAIQKKGKEILKIGKEHRNPFLNIKNDHINIGLFGDIRNKTELAFRFVYGDFYEYFYRDFTTNFNDVDLTKIVEVNNEIFKLSVIDSTFVKKIDKSYYSAVNGIIFVFNFTIISSPDDDYLVKIDDTYNEASNAVKDKLIAVFLFLIFKENDIELNQLINERIANIEHRYNCKVFLFSTKKGENIEDPFYYLSKKILQYNKKANKTTKKRKPYRSLK